MEKHTILREAEQILQSVGLVQHEVEKFLSVLALATEPELRDFLDVTKQDPMFVRRVWNIFKEKSAAVQSKDRVIWQRILEEEQQLLHSV